jgi:hypothetical protein
MTTERNSATSHANGPGISHYFECFSEPEPGISDAVWSDSEEDEENWICHCVECFSEKCRCLLPSCYSDCRHRRTYRRIKKSADHSIKRVPYFFSISPWDVKLRPSAYSCKNLPRDHTKCKKTITCKCLECKKILNTKCNCRECESKRFPGHFKKFKCSCKICTRTPNFEIISEEFNQEFKYYDHIKEKYRKELKHSFEDTAAVATHYGNDEIEEIQKAAKRAKNELYESVEGNPANLRKCQKFRIQVELQKSWNLQLQNYMPKMLKFQREKKLAVEGFCETYGRMPPCFRERMSM